ncbi:MAG TPA: right-handed parallel beta-helix repeat-containing protein [Stellaceae bacterium]|nr:right-handed parallel beta-helix repeat-containing protein [Stellaceae bacterium]
MDTTEVTRQLLRRRLVGALLVAPATSLIAPRRPLSAQARHRSVDPAASCRPPRLVPSGPVVTTADGQVIENLDIYVGSGNGVTVLHRGVTVRNCRIRHAGGNGLHAEGARGLRLHDLEIEHVGAPAIGVGPNEDRNNLNLDGCAGAIVTRVRASRGSANIYALRSAHLRLIFLELHDARGPSPRGQNVQFDRSPYSILQNFSAENGASSWTEDNVSVFRSDGCIVRRGLVSYNNSPTGDGVMLEGSFACVVEEVDAVQQGNSAFAATPNDAAGSGGCIFRRCRTRETYNSSRDGRPAPSSGGLSFYTRVSAGARKHTITACHYDALANPANLLWDAHAVNRGWSITHRRFQARGAIRLAFGWEHAERPPACRPQR